MKTISILGAGSHTRSSINLLRHYYENFIFNIFDDSHNDAQKEFIHNIQLLGKINDIKDDTLIFLSMGDNQQRKLMYEQYKEYLINENLFHQTSFVENNLTIGNSNQIFANVYINSYVTIGSNNIINSCAILEHEVSIGHHNHVSVGAKLCGRVNIGSLCMIGAGAIIIDNVSVCDNVTIGAGSVVIKDINEAGTYVGNPARKVT